MPLRADDVGFDLACAPGPEGHWRGWYDVHVRAEALRPLGLHPEQPTSRPAGTSPPRWWHAATERNAAGIWPVDE